VLKSDHVNVTLNLIINTIMTTMMGQGMQLTCTNVQNACTKS